MYTKLENALMAEVREANKVDPELLELHRSHLENQLPANYSVQHGFLLYQSCFFLPRDSPLIAKVLYEFHSTPQGGHAGVLKTYKRVAEQLLEKAY